MRRYGAALLVLLAGSCSAFGESAERLSGTPSTPRPTPLPSAIATAADGLPRIVVDAPPVDAEVASPLVVRGTADVSHAVVHLRLTSGDGSLVSGIDTTASCGDGCRGAFRVELHFFVQARQAAILQVFGDGAEDGSPTGVVEVPLTLFP